MVDIKETYAIICLVFNVVNPGFGTLVSSCMDRNGCNCSALAVACAQCMTAGCIIGWIWSIAHGIALYDNSKGKL